MYEELSAKPSNGAGYARRDDLGLGSMEYLGEAAMQAAAHTYRVQIRRLAAYGIKACCWIGSGRFVVGRPLAVCLLDE